MRLQRFDFYFQDMNDKLYYWCHYRPTQKNKLFISIFRIEWFKQIRDDTIKSAEMSKRNSILMKDHQFQLIKLLERKLYLLSNSQSKLIYRTTSKILRKLQRKARQCHPNVIDDIFGPWSTPAFMHVKTMKDLLNC